MDDNNNNVHNNIHNGVQKVLITGVTGQDGSNMIDYLLKNTNHIIYGTIRKFTDTSHKNIKHNVKNKRLKLIRLDITDSQSIRNNIKEIKPNFFINFAAQSFVGTSWKEPLLTFNTNTMPVITILESIKEYCPECRFYSAGSSEEFGDIDYSPQNLQHKRKPRSPYGASKCAAAHLVKVYRESYNLYAIHSILFNHEGVRRGKEFVTRKITSELVRISNDLLKINNNLMKKEDFIPLKLGNINAKRDWSDSEDFVEAIWIMLQQYTSRDYLLSSDETHSIKEFIDICLSHLKLNDGIWNISDNPIDTCYTYNGIKIIEIDEKFFRPAEVDLLCGDSTETRKLLKWEPSISFQNLVKKMIDNDLKLAML